MEIFAGEQLNLQAFDGVLRQALDDFNEVLVAAAESGSPAIESTHFLVALSHMSGGVLSSELPRFGLTAASWRKGLLTHAASDPSAPPLDGVRPATLDDSGRQMFDRMAECCREHGCDRIGDRVLLLCALRSLPEKPRSLLNAAGIDLAKWCSDLEESLKPPPEPVAVFADDAERSVDMLVFLPSARKALSLMQTEAESLGCAVIDTRHLLLGMLALDASSLQYGLHQQGVAPKQVLEATMLSLQSKNRATRIQTPLDESHLQSLLRRILALSGEIAARDHVEKIAEPHLLLAFLKIESIARKILEDEKVDIDRLVEVAKRRDIAEEEESQEQADALTIADIDTVRGRLKQRLVGQDDSIERILPYVQRMRFGFSVAERPEGVFLFCGPSGTGKTEMAKELARAVFGTEENLIFLEMGQFNSAESMNIFVGAPPGYVGYGEGKLTNGLRDKPRAVVLFDEVEKAHPRVLDALLRFLDEGRIDDPGGPVRDGSQCIVILTSNVGSEELAALWKQVQTNPNWRTIVRKRLRTLFKEHNFRVEFLNRVDELVLFRRLEGDDYAKISERFLDRYLARLSRERQIEVVVESVHEKIGAYCADADEGARAALRLALSVVVTPVIDFVVREGCQPPVKLLVRGERADEDPESEPYGVVSRCGE